MKKLINILITIIISLSFFNTAYASEIMNNFEKATTNHDEFVDFSKMKYTKEQAINEFNYFVSGNKNAWKVTSNYNIKYKGNYITKLIYEYRYTKEETAEYQQYIDDTENEIVRQASTYTTDYEKAKFVFNYLIDNYDYDYSYQTLTTLDFYKTKKGVCRCFAIAYKDILNKMNINCEVVISKEMQHQWNIVEIDGQWYNVDCTFANDDVNSKDIYFLKSNLFFKFLGYTGGIAYNNLTATSNYTIQ